MTERVRIEVDDAELEAVIARLDEAILKKAELVTRVPVGVPEAPAVEAAEGEVEAVIDRLKTDLDTVHTEAEATEAYVDLIIDRVVAKTIAVKEVATAVSQDTSIKLLETETRMKAVMGYARELPQIDRATRMILLKIPGINWLLRLIYIIKMEERTLRLGKTELDLIAIDTEVLLKRLEAEIGAVKTASMVVEASVEATVQRLTAEIAGVQAAAQTTLASIRGPVTAALTLILYTYMVIQWFQRRQERIEARMDALEREMDQRHVTMEEALRGYGELPERYRSAIAP